MPDSTDQSVMCFSIGSNSSIKADNIKFENNEIECKSLMDLFVLKKATNVSIKNNNIKYTEVNAEFNNFFTYIPENTVKNLDFTKNIIEINNDSSQSINGIFNSASAEGINFTKNKITVNSNIAEAFSGGFNNSDNEITFNGTIHVIANKPKTFANNKIILNNKTDSYFQYYVGKLEWKSNMLDNVFENNFDEIGTGSASAIFSFNGGTLNNNVVNFKGNTVTGDEINVDEGRLYTLTLADETPQTIRIENNIIKGYKQTVKYQNKAEHNVIVENNQTT